MITILKVCVLTRIGFFFLQVLVSLLPDHKADAYIDPSSKPHPWPIKALFGGYDNWDSQYYLTIAERGYADEQFLVFFPLYPLLIRTMSLTLLYPLSLFLPFCSTLLLSGWLLTNVSFVIATGLLYRLTYRLMYDSRLSYYSCLFFCFNPATVFMCTVYTESLFVCLCFAGMLAIVNGRPTVASMLFALSAATRSNGVLTAGFIVYYHVQIYLSVILYNRSVKFCVRRLLKQLFQLVFQVGIVLAPIVCFQLYGYYLLCVNKTINTVMAPSLISFCTQSSLPIVYSYLQQEHWGLGFLGYYQLKQIPNFLLASPMIILLSACFKTYFCSLPRENFFHKLLLVQNSKGFQGNMMLFPFMVHAAFLFLVATTSMHIQVITRFVCSSSPIVFWFSSFQFINNTRTPVRVPVQVSRVLSDLSLTAFRHYGSVQLIVLYCLVYVLLGFMLHCNFLPWT